ncbi:MAG: Trehalose import ATP-binding protein SugC [Phycisphaerae bacterium]|nr:Trehalose import ATP-binding protein SugC [Phycisphaerae bacterium]
MARVLLEDVSKVYPGNVKAVDRFNLDVADQEFVVLVGPSGCGKSTTLRMVAGLEEISEGRIRIGDRVVNDVPPKDRDIAMVFQNYALYPHMTVFKNMAFGLKLRKYPKKEIEERVQEAARILGIGNLLDRKPKALSGGQRQRVAVGRAIVRQPKAFLFDEPLSNLDAKLRVEMRGELKKLHRKLMTTTMYVTHDQEEAMTLGDRVVVMKDGLVQQCAPPLEVYDYPANRFVASFIGSPPMNMFTGDLLSEGGHLYFVEGPGNRIRVPDRHREGLGRYAGQAGLVMGVRPENVSERSDGDFAGPDNALNVEVTVVEPLGDKMDVFVKTARHDHVCCRVDAHAKIEEGQKLPMRLDMRRVHFFEPGETGMNVSLNGASVGG